MARPTRDEIRRAFASAVWALALEVDLIAESLDRDDLEQVLGHTLRSLGDDAAAILRAAPDTRRAVLAHALFARLDADPHTALVRPRRQLAADSMLVDCMQRRPLVAWRIAPGRDDGDLRASIADGSNSHETYAILTLAMLDGQATADHGGLVAGWCVELCGSRALIGLSRVELDTTDARLDTARRTWLSQLLGRRLT